MLERWTRLVIRHRFAISLFWLALLTVGVCAGLNLNRHLTTSLVVPGSQSAKAEKILSDHFQENIEGTFTVVYKFKNASKLEIDGFKRKISTVAADVPTSRVTFERVLGGVLYVNIGTSFALPEAAAYTETIRKSLVVEGLDGALSRNDRAST